MRLLSGLGHTALLLLLLGGLLGLLQARLLLLGVHLLLQELGLLGLTLGLVDGLRKKKNIPHYT